MMKDVMSVMLAALLALSILPGCGKGSGEEPHRRDDVVKPERPGAGDNAGDGNSAELADAVWRYVGSGLELRYDAAGILFTMMADGSIEIMNIDGLDRVKARIGTIGADSVAHDVSLSVNGTELKPANFKMHKQTGESVWYRVAMTDGSTSLLVVPAK